MCTVMDAFLKYVFVRAGKHTSVHDVHPHNVNSQCYIYYGLITLLTHAFTILRVHVTSPILGEHISAIVLPQTRTQWLLV